MDFKFAIGQVVTTKESQAAWDIYQASCSEQERRFHISQGRTLGPQRLMILERTLQECAGGEQIHYLCAYFVSTGYVRSSFNEIELVEYPVL